MLPGFTSWGATDAAVSAAPAAASCARTGIATTAKETIHTNQSRVIHPPNEPPKGSTSFSLCPAPSYPACRASRSMRYLSPQQRRAAPTVGKPIACPAHDGLAKMTGSADLKRPHHVIVLMVENVAVPQIQALAIELHFDSRDHSRIHRDRVLGTELPDLRQDRVPTQLKRSR